MSTTVGRETEGEVDDEAEFGEGRLGLRLMVRVMFWATFRSRKANESAFFSRHTSVNARLLTARGTLKYPIPANMSTTTSPAAICLAKCMRSVPFPDANITRDTSSEYLMPPSTCVVSQDPVLFLSPLALPFLGLEPKSLQSCLVFSILRTLWQQIQRPGLPAPLQRPCRCAEQRWAVR